MNKNDFFTIFAFPFKYEKGDDGEIRPDEVSNGLVGDNNDREKGWAREIYSLDTTDNYNEYYYFHPFVRKAVFNKKGNTGMEYLLRTDYKYLEVEYIYDDKHEADDSKKKKKNLIVTDIKSIDLHLFDNQIGLLTITTEKCADDTEMSFSDLLRYNDIARRVYSPYIVPGKNNTGSVKSDSQLLPCRITIYNGNNEAENVSECFEHIPLAKNNDRDILYLSGIVKKLLFPFELREGKEKKEDKIYFTPFTDDRMFVISYYADKKLSYDLTKRCCDSYAYENSNDWYKFLFVDGNDIGIQNNFMKKELIQKHTYSRWADYGTLFGMSRYSLVVIGDEGWFCENVLKKHMKSMYYQMALIVLFQRAMLLKFSDDILRITKDLENTRLDKLQEETSKLHGDFIRFINKYWFIEVTPQEQGIEMYNQWMGLLNMDKLYQEVQKEISELAAYVRTKIEWERNRNLYWITTIGFPLIILGLVISFWQIYRNGIDRFDPFTFSGWKELIYAAFHVNSFIFLFVISIVISTIAITLVVAFIRWKFKK